MSILSNAKHYSDAARDEVLCFGWIDGQAAKYDDDSFLQNFGQQPSASTRFDNRHEDVRFCVSFARSAIRLPYYGA